MIFTLHELFDIVLMIIALGFIFMNMFKPKHPYSYFNISQGFDYDSFKTAIYIIAPAIVLHEFGHKFTALMFGLSASFHAAYFWLMLGIVLRLIGSSFIFFVPAYVAIQGSAVYWKYGLIAFAGPFVNFLLFLGSVIYLKYLKHNKKYIKHKTMMILLLSKKINLFLFIFNMLPIPMFDGFSVFKALFLFIKSLL